MQTFGKGQPTEGSTMFTQFTNPATKQQFVTFHEGVDTGQAYDITQTSDDIHDGAILIVPSEGVVGVMVRAWPTAVTNATGQFHGFAESPSEEYAEAYGLAVRLAGILEFSV